MELRNIRPPDPSTSLINGVTSWLRRVSPGSSIPDAGIGERIASVEGYKKYELYARYKKERYRRILERTISWWEAQRKEVMTIDHHNNRIMTDGGEDVDDTREKRREQLHLLTQETRAVIVQNILGHSCMMPSLKELDYYNPSKSAGTISGHLDKLIDEDIVMRVTLPQGERKRSLPSTFFTLTDEGYDLLKRHALFIPELKEIREDHANVEKTEKVEKYESAPRPTVDVDYDHPLQGDGWEIVEPGGCSGDDSDEQETDDIEVVV